MSADRRNGQMCVAAGVTMAEAKWYAVMTKAAVGFRGRRRVFGEFAAVARLKSAGYEAFAPTLRRLVLPHRHARRRVAVHFPMFPGYCFARFDAGVPQSALARWTEIVDVVRVGGEPAVVPPRQIAAVRALEAASEHDTAGLASVSARRPPKPGDWVAHYASAFDRALAMVEAVHRDEAMLVMEMLGGRRRVRARIADLEVIVRTADSAHDA